MATNKSPWFMASIIAVLFSAAAFANYDPHTGRFLTRDPIGYKDGMSLYLYTSNNPVVFVDLFGLSCKYKLFLTFDDGPVYGTDDVLNNLKSESVKASFFVNGYNLDPERMGENRAHWNAIVLKRIVVEGHLLGNHSYSHVYRYDDPDWMVKDFDKNVEAIKKVLGELYPNTMSKYARLPGSNTWRIGDIYEDVITKDKSTKGTADALVKAGYKIYGWDTEWQQSGAWGLKQTPEQMASIIIDAFVNRKTRKADKQILLSHDRLFRTSKGNGTKLQELIQILKKSGKDITFHTLKAY